MKRFISALSFVVAVASCGGARGTAIKHAEWQCFEADYQSLKSKLSNAFSDPLETALELTAGEAACAVLALAAKPPAAGSAAP